MSQEFYDWLDKCPGEGTITYIFDVEEEEEEEEED